MNCAPDAVDSSPRTLKLRYCPNRQWFAVSIVRVDCDQSSEFVLWGWRDGDDFNQEDIDQLKSWGVRCEVRIDGVVQFLPETYYMLHDTPMVRALLKKLDTETARRLEKQVESVMEQAKSQGLVPAQYMQGANGEVSLTPMDYRQIHFVKA